MIITPTAFIKLYFSRLYTPYKIIEERRIYIFIRETFSFFKNVSQLFESQFNAFLLSFFFFF